MVEVVDFYRNEESTSKDLGTGKNPECGYEKILRKKTYGKSLVKLFTKIKFPRL